MKRFRYYSKCTGELYTSLADAVATIIRDMIKYKKCRTVEMLSIGRVHREV